MLRSAWLFAPFFQGYFIHSLSTLYYYNAPSLTTRLTGDYRDRTYTGKCGPALLDHTKTKSRYTDIKNQQEEEKSQKQKQNMEDLLKNGIVGTKKSEQGTIQAKSKEEMKLNIKPTIVKPMRYPVSISEGELHPA